MSPFEDTNVQSNIVLISYCCSLSMALSKWNPFLLLLLCNLSVNACRENRTAAWLEAHADCRRCTLALRFVKEKTDFFVLCVGTRNIIMLLYCVCRGQNCEISGCYHPGNWYNYLGCNEHLFFPFLLSYNFNYCGRMCL